MRTHMAAARGRTRWTTFVTALTIALTALLVAPAFAAPRAGGEQINVFGSGAAEVVADSPFYVRHGWHVRFCDDPVDGGAVGAYRFALDLDGAPASPGRPAVVRGDDGCLARVTLFAFPDGLPAGEYVLTGHWFLPCQTALDADFLGPDATCPWKNRPVEVLTASRTLVVVDGA